MASPRLLPSSEDLEDGEDGGVRFVLKPDTYSFPMVFQRAVLEKNGDALPSWKEWAVEGLIVLLSLCVFLVQALVLLIVVGEDMWKLVADSSAALRRFQLGAMAVLYLSLLPDLRGAADLGELLWQSLEEHEPHWLKAWKCKQLLFVVLQAFSVALAAYASGLFIIAQTSRANVILGAFTLTFVVTLDELIMGGVMAFLNMKEGANFCGYVLSWEFQRNPHSKSWKAVLRSKIATVLHKCFSEEAVQRVVDVMVVLESHTSLSRLMQLLAWVVLMHPALLMRMAMVEKAVLPYATTAGNCSGLSGHLANFTEIVTAHFCEAAAVALDLSSTRATGQGVCLWDENSGDLMMKANSLREGVLRLCQPTTAALHLPTFWGLYLLLGEERFHLCPRNHMLDIRDKTECAAALATHRLQGHGSAACTALSCPVMSAFGVSCVGYSWQAFLGVFGRYPEVKALCKLPSLSS